MFDHGLSLYFSSHEERQLIGADPMEDKRVQCFVGSNSAENNLRLIPPGGLVLEGCLAESFREELFADLHAAMPLPWRDAIWELIRNRWKHLEYIGLLRK